MFQRCGLCSTVWFCPLIYHPPSVFYVKRCSSGGSHGLLWRLGRTQFTCPSRVLRDQWTKHLRTALKTHSKDGELDKADFEAHMSQYKV